MGGLGAPELIIILFMLLLPAVIIWGIVDAASRPDAAWVAAGQNKTVWIVLQAVGLVFCGLGALVSVVYLLAIRPKLAAAA